MAKRRRLSSSSSSGGPPPPRQDASAAAAAAAAATPSQEPKAVRIRIVNCISPLEDKPTTTYILDRMTSLGVLKDFLRREHDLLQDFILLQEREDGFPSAMYDDDATLAGYGVKYGDNLRMSPPSTIDLHVFNAHVRRMTKIRPSIYCTMSVVKDLIFKRTNQLPRIQILRGKHKLLHQDEYENKTLQSLGFETSALWHQINLYLETSSDAHDKNRITIDVRPHFGVTTNTRVKVHPHCTIKDFKATVLFADAYTSVTFKGKMLRDCHSFSYYKVKEGDSVDIWEGDVPQPTRV